MFNCMSVFRTIQTVHQCSCPGERLQVVDGAVYNDHRRFWEAYREKEDGGNEAVHE